MALRIQTSNFGNDKTIRYDFNENKKYNYMSHMHQHIELTILFDGEVEITVDEKAETLHPGQAALIFPFQPHEYKSSAPNTMAIFVFPSSILPEFFKSVEGKSANEFAFSLDPQTLASFNERVISRKEKSIYDIKGCLYFALTDFLQQVEFFPASKKNNMPAVIVDYITRHLNEETTLEAVANELGYSPKYLSNCIAKLFGMNFSALVANIRVDKARYLLRNTELSRAQVCYECGFGSERSFHRQFKQVMNFSPEEYRKEFLHKNISDPQRFTFE
ncbi:MAG: helix-turn-helix transcriptional regulator [Clostridia bacterium]|nr:helix-turn-helix transcriptional regulator [Clostridia bacterium]